jgi:hypothetical protein
LHSMHNPDRKPVWSGENSRGRAFFASPRCGRARKEPRRGKGYSLAHPALFLLLSSMYSVAAAPVRWEKLSDHYYSYQCKSDGLNVGAIVSDDGILLINPPAEPELSEALEALKRVSTKQIRWATATDPQIGGGMSRLAEQATTLIGSSAQKGSGPGAPLTLAFDRQMRLFPGGIEVRILAIHPKSHSSADLAVLVPAEKIVQVGDLYSQNAFPVINEETDGGSAYEWVDGMKQLIDAVPLLKPAIPPPPKPNPKLPAGKTPSPPVPGPEKTLPEKTVEEEFTVITGHGPRSNMMEVKAIHDMAQKLRSEVTRLAGGSLARENLASWPALSNYRSFAGFEGYALQLFDAAKKKASAKKP